MTIDYAQASRQLIEGLHKSARELGANWAIMDTGAFREIPGKNYTARTESNLVYYGEQAVPRKREITAVLFRPNDHTGDSPLLPKRKEGEAEFYISIGSNIDGQWISGLTCLELLTLRKTGSTFCYKRIASNTQEYEAMLKSLVHEKSEVVKLRRFDFTLDRSRKYGDLHLTRFNGMLNLTVLPRFISYQIGAFVAFDEPCKELDLLREKVRTDAV